MSFSMLLEFLRYIGCFFLTKEGIADVVIVRRYQTPTGWVGELYVDGRQVGMTCDHFNGSVEIYRQPVRISLEDGHRVLLNEAYVLTSGEFTSSVPFNTAYVGSVDPNTNKRALGCLIKAVSRKAAVRLTVLNRIWSWLEN